MHLCQIGGMQYFLLQRIINLISSTGDIHAFKSLFNMETCSNYLLISKGPVIHRCAN